MTNAKFPMMLDAERAKYVAREIKYEQEIATLREQLILRDKFYKLKTGLQIGTVEASSANQTEAMTLEQKLRAHLQSTQEPDPWYKECYEALLSRDVEIAELKVVSDHNLHIYQEAASKMRAEIATLREQLAAANTLIRTYREASDQLRVNRDDGSTDWRGENEV